MYYYVGNEDNYTMVTEKMKVYGIKMKTLAEISYYLKKGYHHETLASKGDHTRCVCKTAHDYVKDYLIYFSNQNHDYLVKVPEDNDWIN